MNGERGADRMGSREPGSGKRNWLTVSPELKQAREAPSQHRSERLRDNLTVERRSLAIWQTRCIREIHPKADHHAIAAAFEENARELPAREQQVVGPFQH